MAHDLPPAQLLALADTDVRSSIPSETLTPILSRPPFTHVPGTFNTRDVGQVPGSPIRPGYVFRSGTLEVLGDDGKQTLVQKLGIKRIFDLRAGHEREKHPEPDIAGVQNDWVPNSYANTVDMDDFVSGGGEEGYCKMYMDILDVYTSTMRAVLEHVRDRPEEPFLFHCALGRDRTGILAGLLLSLAGATDETIALDYMLTRIGSDPVRELLLKRAVQEDGCEGGLDDPAFYNLCSLRIGSWELFVREMRAKYGGFRGYVINTLGFSEGELDQIRKNLAA